MFHRNFRRERTAIVTLMSNVACACALIAGLGIAVGAQGKKPKPPSKYPGIAEFRCAGGPTMDECAAHPEDRIRGPVDETYPFIASGPDAPAGAGLFSGNSEMHISLDGGGHGVYSVDLDFSGMAHADSLRPCHATSAGCRFPTTLGPSALPVTIQVAEIQSNVVNANGDEVAGGLFSIPVGGVGTTTRFRFGFQHPDDPRIAWHLNFSSVHYAGATHASVRRTASCTWVFETDGDDRAGLWGWGNLSTRGKNVRTDEGLFVMPMKLTFTALEHPSC
jgi:hypothetical protein